MHSIQLACLLTYIKIDQKIIYKAISRTNRSTMKIFHLQFLSSFSECSLLKSVTHYFVCCISSYIFYFDLFFFCLIYRIQIPITVHSHIQKVIQSTIHNNHNPAINQSTNYIILIVFLYTLSI